jgi:hypothetical protein
MEMSSSRRVTAKEAAEILGVPVHLISRLDVAGRWIKRFKLTRKTHVYDVQSLYEYLEACRVKPVQRPNVNANGMRPIASPSANASSPRSSLLDILNKKLNAIER